MLSAYYGPFQPSLEDAFLKEIASLREDDPFSPIAVVTPSRRLADRLQRLIALESGAAYLGITFHTFYSLAMEIASGRVRKDARALVREPLFFDRLLDSFLETPGAGTRPRGLAASYRSSLKDLIDAGVGPDTVDLLEEGLIHDKEEKERLRGLLATLQRYDRRMADLGVMPASGLVLNATDAVREGGALSRYCRLIYYGFYDLTGLQADFFEAVAGEHPVSLYFPYRKGHPAFSFADRFFETKLHLGGRSPQRLPVTTEGRALGGALDALFAPGRSGGVEEGRLRFFSASGVRDEAWRASKEILHLVEKEGFAFEDIGVVVRTLDPYRAAMDEAFGEALIPYYLNAEEPLLRRPAAKTAWTLLTLARRDFPALSVLDVTCSPFFRGKTGSQWRRLVERLRIHRGWLQWEGKLLPASDKDFRLYEDAKGKSGVIPRKEIRALWDLVGGWRDALTPPGRRKWSEWVEYAGDFLGKYLDAKDSGYEDLLEALGRLRVFDLLGEKTDFSGFMETLEDRIPRLGRKRMDREVRGVRVLDAMQARGDSFKVLFLMGLQEGTFPRTIREDPLLRDTSRVVLARDGGFWISAKQSGYEEEKLLFYLLAASPSRRLYCSYPRSDEDGRAQVPSIYLHDLCRAAGLSFSDPDRVEHVPRPPEQKLAREQWAPYLTPKEASISASLAYADVRPLHRAVGFDARGYHALTGRVDILNTFGKPGAMDGILGPPVEFLKRLRVKGLSPSALETFAKCPFQFFASRVLGLASPEEPSESGEISPAVKGEIYHAILGGLYERLRKAGFWKGPLKDFPEQELREEEREVFGRFTWRELGVYPLLWAITIRGMRENIRRFVSWDLECLREFGLTPRYFEEELRAELPLNMPETLAGMSFQGRADRIDVGKETFRVVDYKTRWRKGRLELLAQKGQVFQPTLYRELAERHPKLKGLRPDGVRFLFLEDAPELNGRETEQVYREESHLKNRELLLGHITKTLDGIAHGRFPIRPDEGQFGHCRWCSFGDLCRKNHSMTLARTQEVEC